MIIDLDFNLEEVLDRCKKYTNNYNMILGISTKPTRSIILKAKKDGCFMVTLKSSFSTNLLDILKQSEYANWIIEK